VDGIVTENLISKNKKMIKDKKTITFTGEQLEEFLEEDGTHPDFPGWEFSTDTDEGEYDSGKSSMVQYPLYMYNSNTDESYSAIGGYYNQGCGERFYSDVTFDLDRDVVSIRNDHPYVRDSKSSYFLATVTVKVMVDTTDTEITTEEATDRVKHGLNNGELTFESINFLQ
jgi:hypothetical protein